MSEKSENRSERKIWKEIAEKDPYFGTSGPTRAIPKAGILAKPDASLFVIIHQGSSVLDVGCGYGRNCVPLMKLHLCQVVACDISTAMAENVREAGVPLVMCDLRNLPFPSQAFDYLICSVVLIHLPRNEIEMAITELNRVGRRALIIMPNPIGPSAFFGLLPIFSAFLVWVKKRGGFSILRDVPTFRGYLVNYYIPWRFSRLLKRQFGRVSVRSARNWTQNPYVGDRVLYVCGPDA